MRLSWNCCQTLDIEPVSSETRTCSLSLRGSPEKASAVPAVSNSGSSAASSSKSASI